MAGELTGGDVFISYNGVEFDYRSSVELDIKPVPDASGRTVMTWAYTFTVHGYVTADDEDDFNTDDQFDDLEKNLMTYGGELIISGLGYGDIHVNNPDGSGTRDLQWGPKPQSFRAKRAGAQAAAKVTWVCTTMIARCPDGTTALNKNSPMEYVFRVSWSVDKSGYTTRNYGGHLRIPQTRGTVNSKILIDNADNYRTNVMIACPVGFRRTQETFTLDESKCVLNFQIVDEEMPPNIPPPGVINVEAKHTVVSQRKNTFFFTSTLTATYEMAKYVPPKDALIYFRSLFLSRYLLAKTGPAGGASIIRHLTYEEELYGRNVVSMSITWDIAVSAAQIVARSGLFTPLPNTNYALWRASVADAIFTADGRGLAKQRFQNGEDVIVDLCANNAATLRSVGALPTTPRGGRFESFQNDRPPPGKSFLDYRMNVVVNQDDQVVELKPLPTAPVGAGHFGSNQIGLGNMNAPIGGKIISDTGDGFQPYPANEVSSIPQVRAQPSVYITLEGSAVRAGYPITPPFLVSAGGVPLVPLNRDGENGFKSGVVANWFGVPIVGATWSIRYMLPTTPGPIGIPENPLVA